MFGTLGLGHNTEVNECIEIKELSNQKINSIFNGYNFVLGSTEENQLWGWGINHFGQLGRGDVRTEYLKPQQIEYFKNKNISQICCGDNHTLVLLSDGELVGWGSNDFGQLGLITENILKEPTKLEIQTGKDLKFNYIYCQFNHSFAITTDGLLFSWGLNTFGMLGHVINVESKSFPRQINLKKVIKLMCSNNNTYFLTNEGHVYYCGNESRIANSYLDWPRRIEQLNNITIKDFQRNHQVQTQAICLDSSNQFYLLAFGQVQIFEDSYYSIVDFCAKNYETTPQMIEITEESKPKIQNFIENKKLENVSSLIRYIRFEELGSGGFGVTEKLQNVCDEQFYAIKKIDITGVGKLDEEMHKELKIIAGLQSQHLVRYHNSWFKNNFLFIQMEYCFNNLRNVLKTKPQVFERTENQAMNSIEYFISCEIFRQIAEALNYLHSFEPNPIIHRDLKPENILIANSENGIKCKLSDFGFSKFIDSHPLYHKAVITGMYTSMEILSGKGYDIKADIYSLGVIGTELFEFTYEGGSSRYKDKEFKGKVESCEKTITVDMAIAVPYRRPLCVELLKAMKDWSMDCNQIRTDPQFTHYLEKFKTNDFIYFHQILSDIQLSFATELCETPTNS